MDEVQFAPELLPAIKRRVDQSDQKGQYLLTGSQHLGVLKNISETLTGRVGVVELENMSYYEEREHLNHWAIALFEDPKQLLANFNKTLNHEPLTHILSAWKKR